MNIDLIVDLQYGSTGKGLLAGYLAEKKQPVAVINCNMPNAGHTYIDSKGNKMIHKVLPNGIVSENLKYVLIGPGSVISTNRMIEEIEHCKHLGYLKDVDIVVHPNAAVLNDEHALVERNMLNNIASTMQGSATATIQKMMRSDEEPILAQDYRAEFEDMGAKVANHTQWQVILESLYNSYILAEGSQGFSLGLNQRFWPYCTSRECGPLRLLSDMGLPWGGFRMYTVYGTLRTFPIRVGNTPNGFSGEWYPDQRELTWNNLGQTPELTTVTQRERRVATFSFDQLREAMFYCQPDYLFLNFVNYLSRNKADELIDQIRDVADEYGSTVALAGHGPSFRDVKIVDLEEEL